MVAAARALLGEGTIPTVEQAADRAGISRATAYRYFKNQRLLIASVHPDIRPSLLPADPPRDPVERAVLVATEIMRRVVENETELRAMLRISLGGDDDKPDMPLRKGRRIMWFEDALSPLQPALSEQHHRRLVLACAAAVGIEPYVWLTDMAGVSGQEAAEIVVDTVEALVRGTVLRHDQGTSPKRSTSATR
ncbi:MAG: hypothetical protein QOE60_1293 [Thermoleophilaceae bacterium]|nr:hypothetical protein [Thermoleophilaceae bacterium]